MCWTIMWHFKQNPDALMCFFFFSSHKCWVRQICTLAGGTTLLIPVVASALTPSCCSHVPSDHSGEQETFLHPKRMFTGAGIAATKLRDTKWSQISASVAPSPFFSRLMRKAGFSQCICTMFWGCGSPELCRKWLVTSFCPCRLDLSLSHRAQTCQSNIPGQGLNSPQTS